jgi:hypothetical protein
LGPTARPAASAWRRSRSTRPPRQA